MEIPERNTTSIDVLLVEDSPGDIRLTQEAFRQSCRSIRLHLAFDGIEAMSFLRQEGTHTNAPRPDLILLDLNMPRMDGREILAAIKSDAKLKAIPTIILTTSDAEEDILISYRLQANCYLRKPAHWDAFDHLMRGVNAFWLNEAKLPHDARSEER